eukprot:sb/3475622/
MFPLYCCTVGRVCVREKVRLAAREDIKNLKDWNSAMFQVTAALVLLKILTPTPYTFPQKTPHTLFSRATFARAAKGLLRYQYNNMILAIFYLPAATGKLVPRPGCKELLNRFTSRLLPLADNCL